MGVGFPWRLRFEEEKVSLGRNPKTWRIISSQVLFFFLNLK